MNIVRRNASPLTTYRPRSIEDQFGRMVENMFEDFFAPLSLAAQGASWPGDAATQARLNVTENDQAFDVEVEMPGVKKEDVKVSVEQQRITIEGESKQEDEKREGDNVIYSERSSRRFVRSFMLPSEVDEGNAQARMENGVLKLNLPKKQGSAPTRLTIQ